MINPFKFRLGLANAPESQQTHDSQFFGWSIRSKILFGLVMMSLLPMLIFGYVDIKNSYHAREIDFARMELEHARSIMHAIEIHFDRELQYIEEVAQKRMAPALAQGNAALLTHEVQIMASNPDFECVSLIDVTGKVTQSSCPSLANANLFKETWFGTAVRGQQAYGSLQRDPASGANVIALAVPIFQAGSRQEPIGILVALYRWSEVDAFLSRFQVRGQVQSVSDHVMLTEKSGLVIWCYDPGEILTHHLIEAGMTSAIEAQKGREGYAYEITEHGVPSLSVYTHSKPQAGKVRPEWLLVILHDPKGVFAEVNQRSRNFYLLLTIMSVLLVLVALRLSSSIALPIREVAQAIRRFKDDAPGASVSSSFSGEAGVLANAFNEMAARLVKSKAELRDTWVLHQSILQTAMAGFWLVNDEGLLQEVNRSYCQMSGYTEQELLGRPIAELDAANAVGDFALHLSHATGQDRFETRHRHKDGSWFDVEISVQTLAGRAGWFVVFVQDITERKRADQLLQQSLKDKQALLKEVHHRVKNNLQVIVSLLRLESGRSASADTKAVLASMQGRIRSMALLHESLYRSGTFASVDLGAYLGQLVPLAFRTQQTAPSRVLLKLSLGSVQVGMDQAISTGLLVNELISNCLKHGFPQGQSGEVGVELQPVDPAQTGSNALWRLCVSDTGVGLPADFESRRKTALGLQLVSDLCRQVGGQLTLESQPGVVTEFAVVFKALEPVALVMPA